MNVYIEAVEDKKELKYVIPLKIMSTENPNIIPIKFDNGAAYTVITASMFSSKLIKSDAGPLNERLSRWKTPGTEQNPAGTAPFRKVFHSATGHAMTGYLVDAGNIELGDTQLDHFFYYFIPQNDRSVALFGNDFLRYCEYTHTIEGSIVITKIDKDAYARYYSNAVSIDELAAVIDEIEQGNADDKSTFSHAITQNSFHK
jgi:hypothetical protein